MDYWTIGGAVLSGIGAGISIWQAHRAKRYRDEILADRVRMALIEMSGSLKAARDECKKIMTPVSKPMRGVDAAKVIGLIQSCAEKLKENGHRLGITGVEVLAATLEGHLGAFTANPDLAFRQKKADEIYECLNELVAQVARQIDAVV